MVIYSLNFDDSNNNLPENLFCRAATENAEIFCEEKQNVRCLTLFDGGNDYISPDTFMPSTFCESFFKRQYGQISVELNVCLDKRCREDYGMVFGLRGYDRNHAISIEFKKNRIVQRIGNVNHWLYDKEIVLAENIDADHWYNIRLNVDIEKHMFDFYLNGELKKEHVVFWKFVDNIASFVIGAGRKDPRVERCLSVADIKIETIRQSALPEAYSCRKRIHGKAPFKTLYGNDLTNAGIRWFTRPDDYLEALKSTVTELKDTGVDVCLFQPYMTTVPLWPSKFYPPLEHIKWWRETYKTDVGQILKIVERGVDIVGEYVNWCKDSNISPFLSVRLNDTHHMAHIRDIDNFNPTPNLAEVLPRFYIEHVEWMLGRDKDEKTWDQISLNWRLEEPRKIRLEFIKELVEYDIEGIELDFMRNSSFYRPDELSFDEMEIITTNFVKEVRKILDDASEKRDNKKKIWLCARIPADSDALQRIGISIPKIIEAGVEMLNISSSLHTVNYEDLEKITKQADGVALYREGCNSSGTTGNGDINTCAYKRTTPLQFYTQANLAYKSGFDGYSTFNFAYYRWADAPKRGATNEPPFYIYENIGNKEWVANAPQHYTLGWAGDYCASNPHSKRIPLKRHVSCGQFNGFEMRMASPQDGWKEDGKIRIQCESNLRYTSWRLWFNDVELIPTKDKSEFISVYNGGFGNPDEYKAWIVPKELMRDGINYIGVKLEDGDDTEIIYIDLQVGHVERGEWKYQ